MGSFRSCEYEVSVWTCLEYFSFDAFIHKKKKKMNKWYDLDLKDYKTGI